MTRHSAVCPFGTTPTGEPVSLITLDNGILSCQIITYGAAVRSLYVPDRNGTPVDVVLGYDTLQEYVERDGYLGATIGRFANRIAKGRFSLNGHEYTLAANDGANHLHGGRAGFSHRVWALEHLRTDSAVLFLTSADGEEGYPGNMTIRVTYTLDGSSLSIRYHAISDADTLCNLTNHSYFNLSGHGSGPVLDQEITLFARSYTPSNAESIPIGIIAPVEGSPMDFRTPVRIGAHINDSFPQLEQARGYDHNYVVDGQPDTLRPAALAVSSQTGIAMQVSTTQPGLHFYTANFIDDGRPGKYGCIYGPRHAFCLETQCFPDSPNQPEFPSAVLKVNKEYDHITKFAFTARR